MTSHAGILTNIRPYNGLDNVLIGNGEFLRITHVGDASINTESSQLTLHNVLLVPDLERSLLSIGQLTSDYLVNCEFSNRDFVIKDRVTQQVLVKGVKRGNLYSISTSPAAFFSTRFRRASVETWHRRLGHPQAVVVDKLHQKGFIQFLGNKTAPLCESCQLGKRSKLPFLPSLQKTTVAFEKIHIDLWVPAPISSVHSFKYYTAIVDDFTKFIWFIPLKLKSDFSISMCYLKNISFDNLMVVLKQFKPWWWRVYEQSVYNSSA